MGRPRYRTCVDCGQEFDPSRVGQALRCGQCYATLDLELAEGGLTMLEELERAERDGQIVPRSDPEFMDPENREEGEDDGQEQ
jgi:hypothetical protein